MVKWFFSRTAARDEYIKRLTDAWKRPPTCDAREPDNSSSPDLVRKHLHGNEPDDDAARKEQAYATCKDELANAWRSPGVQPQRSLVGPGPTNFIRAVESPDPAVSAERIERLGEQTRGGR